MFRSSTALQVDIIKNIFIIVYSHEFSQKSLLVRQVARRNGDDDDDVFLDDSYRVVTVAMVRHGNGLGMKRLVK